MKNKRNSERDDYRLLKNKLLIRTFGMLFFAFAFLAALYSLFLKGHIADTFVGFLDNFVYHDYDRAYNVYSIYIRDYMSFFFVVLSLLLFAIILRFYLKVTSKNPQKYRPIEAFSIIGQILTCKQCFEKVTLP